MQKKRNNSSLGDFLHNKGKLEVKDVVPDKYVLNHDREYYLFDAIPISKPRMTQSDKWKTNPNHDDPKKRQRKPVTEYYAFKDLLLSQAREMNFELGDIVEVLFVVPMPSSWSGKKKERMAGTKVQTKPDVDNYLKAIMDIFNKNDSHIFSVKAEKRYGYLGSVIIFK